MNADDEEEETGRIFISLENRDGIKIVSDDDINSIILINGKSRTAVARRNNSWVELSRE